MASAFNIVTEFRFDIASAVADSKTLQNQVGLISDTANQALYSLKRVGMGLVMQMGLFSGGMLGFLNAAIQSSEKFGQSQRKLANVFLSNQEIFGKEGITFAQSMKLTSKIMDDINKKGLEFAIDPSQLLAQTGAIAPMLLSHGLDDSKLTRSIDISRGLMKSAPTLSIDPGLVQSQLVQLVMGRAGLDNTLFTRLMSETKPFRDNNIKDSKSYNLLPAQKRIEILRESLLQFGSNAEIIAGNVNSLTGQMQRFFSLIKGEFSVFRSLGTALMKPLIDSLKWANEWIGTQGKQIAESAARLVEEFLQDPIKVYQRLRQFGQLKTDTILAGKVAFLIEVFHILAIAMTFLQLRFAALHGWIMNGVRMVGGLLMQFLRMIPVMTILSFVFGILKALLISVAKVLLPLIFFMQIFSATMAKLETIWAGWMAGNAGKMASVFERITVAMSRIFLPITMAIDGVSDILSGLGGWFVTKDIILGFFEMLADVLEWLAEVMVLALSSIYGFISAFTQMIIDLLDMNLKGMGGRLKEAFDGGAWDFYSSIYKNKNGDGEAPVSQNITNIGKVEVNQSFKEQMEPDRIAFAFMDVLQNVSQNPLSASGSRSKAGMVGR